VVVYLVVPRVVRDFFGREVVRMWYLAIKTLLIRGANISEFCDFCEETKNLINVIWSYMQAQASWSGVSFTHHFTIRCFATFKE